LCLLHFKKEANHKRAVPRLRKYKLKRGREGKSEGNVMRGRPNTTYVSEERAKTMAWSKGRMREGVFWGVAKREYKLMALRLRNHTLITSGGFTYLQGLTKSVEAKLADEGSFGKGFQA
jgi:hypothetical protein